MKKIFLYKRFTNLNRGVIHRKSYAAPVQGLLQNTKKKGEGKYKFYPFAWYGMIYASRFNGCTIKQARGSYTYSSCSPELLRVLNFSH